MTTNLPQRIVGAHLPRWCPPPETGWFGPDCWPTVDADERTAQAVDVLRNSELPEDLQELGELLQRVVDGLANLPSAGSSVMRPASRAVPPTPTKEPR
jgi:hypothetical protein